jgi:hypothetical protein
MTLSIIGKATRSVANLNSFLKTKGCPEYAELYCKAGEKWGVRWDIAVFQSCLETGFWSFKGDVKASQNNFAGIGAKGGGVPGDSFASPAVGIEAQLQNLALRAGAKISKEEIIAPYVKQNYEIISKRGTTTWESLTGTYATDPNYHHKIFAIAEEFDAMFPDEKPDSEAETITKIVLNRKDNGSPVATAYAGDVARWTHIVANNSFEEFKSWCEQFPNVKLIGVEDTSKAFPKLPDYGFVAPPADDPNVDYLPFAKVASKKMKEVANGYPEYFVIHWTAGEPSQSGEAGISEGVANGYTYAFLPRDGQLWQGAPIHDGGYHAGNAKISSLKAFGVEVACAGRLEKIGDLFVPWFAKNKDGSINKGRCIPASQVRYDNDGPEDDGSFKGYYQVYTDEQVKTLVVTALWFVQVRKMPIDNIVGHDEVATPHGRKCDPGFSIGDNGMVGFRNKIKSLVQQGKKWNEI